MSHNEADHNCFEKAKQRGEETFTLVGQDLSSPAVVVEWIKQNIETAPAKKLRCALEDALLMRETPKRKLADLMPQIPPELAEAIRRQRIRSLRHRTPNNRFIDAEQKSHDAELARISQELDCEPVLEEMIRRIRKLKGRARRRDSFARVRDRQAAAPDMLQALEFVKDFFLHLEDGSSADGERIGDLLRNAHWLDASGYAPVHAVLDLAIAKAKEGK